MTSLRKRARPVLVTFAVDVAAGLVVFALTWVAGQFQILVLDPYQAATLALIAFSSVGFALLARQVLAAQRDLARANREIESLKTSGVWDWVLVERQEKTLTPAQPELILKRDWDEQEVKLDFSSDDLIDARITGVTEKVLQRLMPLRLSSLDVIGREGEARFATKATKNWSKTFWTIPGWWFMIASLSEGVEKAHVRVNVFELRRIAQEKSGKDAAPAR